MPLKFNDKLAYFNFLNLNSWNVSIIDILFGEKEFDGESTNYIPDIYYIDFKNLMVKKLTPQVLCNLLEDYHDLQMRYEGMKDYKKRNIIEYFFIEYVNRATQDYMRPSITEYIE